MKKYIAALLVVIMLFTVSVSTQKAYADPLTITALAGAAYTMAQSAGLSWIFTAGTSGNAQSYMEQNLTTWTTNNGGMSIWGSTPVRSILGKLAIGYEAYNLLKDFINDYITENEITTTASEINPGFVGGIMLDHWNTQFQANNDGFWMTYQPKANATQSTTLPGFYSNNWDWQFVFDYGYGSNTATNQGVGQVTGSGTYFKPIAWKVMYEGNNRWRFRVKFYKSNNQSASYQVVEENASTVINGSYQITSKISASIDQDGMQYQTVLTGEQWVADVGEAPDTNLDQLMSEVFQKVANNDLIISNDEVTSDTPATPEPTTVPGTDTNIGQLVGSIAEGVGDIAGTLEGVGEGVGEISETLEGVGENVGSISQALEVPTPAQANSLKLPDLRTLFPFCIPFDIYNIITAFNASPVAPHVQIPFNIPAIGLQYTFDLDFSSYDSVASVLRTVEFVAYAIGLAILTSKVIRW